MSVWYQRLQKLIQNLTSNPTESNTKWLAALHIWDLPHSLLSWVQVKFAGVMSMSYQSSNKKMSLRFGAGSYYHASIKTMYTNNAEHHTHLRFGAKQKVALAVFPHDTHLSMSFWGASRCTPICHPSVKSSNLRAQNAQHFYVRRWFSSCFRWVGFPCWWHNKTFPGLIVDWFQGFFGGGDNERIETCPKKNSASWCGFAHSSGSSAP